MNSLQEYLVAIGVFINSILIPFLFAVGLLFFLYRTFQYFILKGDDAAAREQAKQQAIYGIAAFVFLMSIWGIVNLLISGLGFNNDYPLNSDYVEEGSWRNGSAWTFFDFSVGFEFFGRSENTNNFSPSNNYTDLPDNTNVVPTANPNNPYDESRVPTPTPNPYSDSQVPTPTPRPN
ncbi:hypothetical protein H6783_02060 [Candidatus Nomurabacteria bacterium]|nr:hypothetical protein [Candidatus Nomurabacteria bacterium]